MSNPFIIQLHRLAKEHPTTNKWVMVPTNSIGWMLGERLVLEGTNWTNFRFTTPYQLALDAAAPGLIEEGLNPCPDHLGPTLLQRLLLNHPTNKFAPLILQPGMAEGLWQTLCECRMNRASCGQLEELYQAYLVENRLADRAMVFERALDTKVRPGDIIVRYPYHIWSCVITDFLDGIKAYHEPAASTHLQAPRRYAPARRQVHTVSTAHNRFFFAGRRDLEFQEVLRRIEVPFDQVEVVANPEDLPLLADMLVQNECLATFSEGLPLMFSRPAKALLGVLDWIERGFTGHHVRELLLGNFVKAPPNSWTAASLIQKARIGWGRAEFSRKLDALSQTQENPPAWLSLQSEQAQQLKRWFEGLFQRLSRREILPALQHMVVNDLDQEEEATATLVRILEDLKQLPQPEVFRLLRERIRREPWSASRPRPGHLHVTSLAMVGLSGRPFTFITGQEERHDVPIEDCCLSDEERLSAGLALSTEMVQERRFQIEERLLALEGAVTYSFSLRDRDGEQEQLPSWIFYRKAREAQPQIQSYAELATWLGQPAQPWVAEESEWRLRSLREYPDLERGMEAERQRESGEFTVYDGLVPSAAGLWDPRTNGVGISVSRLQGLARCPFQFFLSKGLGIYPDPLHLPDLDRWLDPSTRGHVLHEVYAKYARQWRRDGSPPGLPELFEMLDESLRDLPRPPLLQVEEEERADLRRDLEHFLKLETARPDRLPLGVEVGFGLGDGPGEPLSLPDPVELDLGEGMRFKFQGRIDRLDKIPGGHSVVDYKTGRSLGLTRDGLYERGRLLQHGLYALAAEKLVQDKVNDSGYYFTSSRSTQGWVSFPAPEAPGLRKVLELVMHPLQTGAFGHGHELEKDCQFCNYRAACTAHRDHSAKSKLSHPQLASRRQLLEER